MALAEFGRMLDYLREAEGLAMSLGDQRRLVSMFMTILLWATGDPERALDFGQRAFAIVSRAG
jgi:hypothetical protein